MILEDTIKFLQGLPPFQFLEESVLKKVAASLSLEFYPKGTVILKQYGPPSDSVKIIKKGGIKVLMESPETGEVVIDYKGEGDTFGFLSLIGKDRQRTTCVALDDTICYILDHNGVYQLLETSPSFTEYYLAYLSHYVDRTYQEMHNKSLSHQGSNRYLFATSVKEIAAKPISIGEQSTIQEAAQLMARHKISSVIIVNQNNAPIGIVTDRDLREKVVARGRSVKEPIKNILTLSLIRVDADDSCFETIIKMIKYNIHHMPVIRDGVLSGIVTNHDLMLLEGTSPLSLVHDIINQTTIDGLIPLSRKTNNIVGLLIKEDAKASNITQIISEINDRLIGKVLEIAELKYGPPPLPYCWIVFGSEGRKEQTFKTDQDNALIYNDAPTPELEGEAKRYFSRFTAFVTEGLVQVGFPLCPAKYMASNEEWCQPLTVWKKYFSNWIDEPLPDHLLKFLIFYDLRPLHGKTALAQELREFLVTALTDQKGFLGHMTNMMSQITPPIGFFKTFVVEKSGEHKDKLDLKVKGLTPLLNAVRLFSMEKGLRVTGTLDRILELKTKHSTVEEYFDEFNQAFEFIMLLRIHHQFEQIKDGKAPDNFINPDELSNLQKKTLKESFNLMTKVQSLIVEQYKTFFR